MADIGHPKPLKVEKEPRPLQRGKPPARSKMVAKRKKRIVGKYQHPAWRKLRLEALKRDEGLCRLRHPGCLGVATTVHHLRYGKGRGVKRLLVALRYLTSACVPCHTIEDPWLGKGMGLGSRERNERNTRADSRTFGE